VEVERDGIRCAPGILVPVKSGTWREPRPTDMVFTLYSRLNMNTAGCTTSWMNYANEPSQTALERSNHGACDVIRLMHSKAAMWTVDDLARLIEI